MELSRTIYEFPNISQNAYNILSKDRREVLDKIALYEREKLFDVDVENDPPTKPLDYEKVDYLGTKFISKMKTAIANRAGAAYFEKLIKKDILVTEAVHGVQHLEALQGGAIVTCNHFATYDNYIVYKALHDRLPQKYLYKIVREGNYTSYRGLYGFLFRNCNTLPLSSSPRGSMALMKAVGQLLGRGETVLIYPEQAMWWNYRKPRPFKSGGFILAYRANVPVVPIYITMRDSDRFDEDGYPIQNHTVHIMPPIYPEQGLAPKAGAEKMRAEAFEMYKNKYEEVYGRVYDL